MASGPRLQDLVVARLRIDLPDQLIPVTALACFVSPERVITVAHVIPDSIAPNQLRLEIQLAASLGALSHARELPAQVVWLDRANDLVMLSVSRKLVGQVLPAEVGEVISERGPSEKDFVDIPYLVPSPDPDTPLSLVGLRGTFVGMAGVAGRDRWRFGLSGELPEDSILGGPVFLDDHVVGLIDHVDQSRREVRVIPATYVRRALEARAEDRQEEPADSSGRPATATATSGSGGRQTSKAPASRSKRAIGKTDTLDASAFWVRLSESSRTALSHADGMRRRLKVRAIHMEELLLALYLKENGPTRREMDRVKISEAILRERLGSIAEVQLPATGSYEVPTLTALPECSAHVREALIAARDAADTRGSSQIQSRHLFYGALSITRCGAVKWMLDEYKVDREEIDMTAAPSSPTAPHPDFDEVRQTDSILGTERAQVVPDVAEGKDLEDLLDVTRDVNAVAAVLAAKDTSPPLSIGLFGDWGTGKSFFMSRMEERIERLKLEARKKPNATAYCPNVVQLRFNAWHYMDTDLWASLAAEIFEGLARALDKDSDLRSDAQVASRTRLSLLAETSHLQELKAEAEQRRSVADEQLRASEEHLKTLDGDDRAVEAKLTPRAIANEAVRFVASQPAVLDALDKAAHAMGVPAGRELARNTRATFLEVKGTWDLIRALFLARREGSRLFVKLLAALLGTLGLAALAFYFRERLALFAPTIVTLLWVLNAGTRKVLVPLNKGLQLIHTAQEQSDEAIQSCRAQLERELRKKQEDIRQNKALEESRIAQITNELKALDERMQALRPDQQMLDFVRQTQASTEYTRHFGVIARARHDFERLSKLLRSVISDSGAATPNGSTRPPVPRIDRIILYIDDLDRCPEAKVVDVLQAVHLLLAFSLFVVVVGVDSRWLLHSLRKESSALRGVDDEENDGMDDEERVHWKATPFNYLEKIFQIPFNLRPMDEAGFTRLINELTIPKLRSGDVGLETIRAPSAAATTHSAQSSQPALDTVTEPQPPAQPDSRGSDTPAPPVATGESTSSVLPPEPDASSPSVAAPSADGDGAPEGTQTPVDPNPPFLTLSDEERQFMRRMHLLIPTPRAAKRYVNVYRLLRASLPVDRQRALEANGGASSRRVLLMLAILTGYPQEGTVILRELVERSPAVGWWSFVQQLAEENTANPTGDPLGPAGNGNRERGATQRAQRWEQLCDRLDQVRRAPGFSAEDPPCAEFREWARFVARYSFEAGRVMAASEARAPVQTTTPQFIPRPVGTPTRRTRRP